MAPPLVSGAARPPVPAPDSASFAAADALLTIGTGLASVGSECPTARWRRAESGRIILSPREVTPSPVQPSSCPFTRHDVDRAAGGSVLSRPLGRGTHTRYAYQLGQWFSWCETSGLNPLIGSQRDHIELYIRGLGDRGLMDSSVLTMMHAVRGYFRFAHIDGVVPADPAVYARLPQVNRDESRTHGLDRLELIRFLQVAQTLTVHHGALAYLLGINALRASELPP